jgi:hypothetical protein
LNLNLKHIISDIRFWIILFFVVRLIGITNPPLEVSHNWRQTTVTMVARNFLEVDNNILYPRVDFAGEKTGITGMEFPIFNYSIYIVSEVFGYAHWYGRLINLIFSSFGLWFFYLLIKKYFKPDAAFNATIILLFSIWFSFSRKIMPDTFSMSLIISCIYFGSNYLENKGNPNKFWNLIFYTLLLTLGALAKLPSAYILIVFLILFLDKEISTQRKLLFSIASFLAIIPVTIWYFYWFPHLVSTYDFWHFSMGKSLSEGATEIIEQLPLALERFYNNALKYIGFFVFIVGLSFSIIKKNKALLAIFGLSFIGYLIIILKAGQIFTHHNYYIIPFVPIMALIAGYGLSQIKNKKIVITLLIVIAAEGVLNQQHDINIHTKSIALLDLEQHLNSVSNKDDLILINSNDYPTPIYFSHHKGWSLSNEKINNKSNVEELKVKGLKHIIILKKVFGTAIQLDYPVSFNNENYTIYKIV